MIYLIGAVLGLAVSGFATVVGLDRDRAFYPTVMIVIAFYYALFAVMGGASGALVAEGGPILLFVAASVAGFRASLWYVVVALAGHGLFDVLHGSMIMDPGVPAWWPPFCLACDIAMAGYLAVLLVRRRVPAQPG